METVKIEPDKYIICYEALSRNIKKYLFVGSHNLRKLFLKIMSMCHFKLVVCVKP